MKNRPVRENRREAKRYGDCMQYRIIVASSKGGVGKSTTSALLAVCLAARGKRVLLCDLDLGTRCLDMFFGVEDSAACDVGDVYLGRVGAERAIVRLGAESDGELYFCPSSAALRPDEVESEKLCETLDSLAAEVNAEYVVCDTAGSVMPVKLAKWANVGLICATQTPASVRSAEASADRLREAGLRTMRLIVTAFDYREARTGLRSGLISLIDGASLRAIGVVPNDRALMLSQERGALPGIRTPAMIAYANVAARLCGEDRPLFQGISGMKGSKVL